VGYKLIDMTGQRFDRLLVLSRASNRADDRNTYWLCECDCGKQTIVSRASLRTKNTRSCGCLHVDTLHDSVMDLTGLVFGRLTVFRRDEIKKGLHHWMCVCECGNEKSIAGQSLKAGQTNSCGCLQKEKAKSQKIPNGGAAKNKLYGQYANKSKKRGYSFELTKDEFLIKTSEQCYYCGTPPTAVFKSKTSSYVYNGIDRVDNKQGYTTINTVACCSICNYAKRELSSKDFSAWVKRIYAYQKSRSNVY